MIRLAGRSLAVTVLGALLFACASEGDAGRTVQQFYDLLNDGNYEQAMGLYTEDARTTLEEITEGDPSAFENWAQGETKDGTVRRVRIVSEEPAESGATVRYEVVYEDGSSAEKTVTLTQKGGDWKLGLIG